MIEQDQEPEPEKEREQPIEDHLHAVMNNIGRLLATAIDEAARVTKHKFGFALLVFPMEESGRMNYISNARREDMLVAMKEFIARNEGRYEGRKANVKQ